MNYTVKIIKLEETITIRHEVLRKGKPIETCHFEGDNLTSTFHLGLFFNEEIIGILSVFETKNDFFKAEKQFQYRGMAILEDFQNKNLGKNLIVEANKICNQKNANLIWFNAREKAMNFYVKNGFKIEGEPFEIENVGTHYLMFLDLKN
jgi:predicted GNAT family N-acyltransferase